MAAHHWALFDGRPVPAWSAAAGQPADVRVQLAQPEWVTAVSIFGHAQGTLELLVPELGERRRSLVREPVEADGSWWRVRLDAPVQADELILRWSSESDASIGEVVLEGLADPVHVDALQDPHALAAAGALPGALEVVLPARRLVQRQLSFESSLPPQAVGRAFLIASDRRDAPSLEGAKLNGAALAPLDLDRDAQVIGFDPGLLRFGINRLELAKPELAGDLELVLLPHGNTMSAANHEALLGATKRTRRDLELSFDRTSAPHTLAVRLEAAGHQARKGSIELRAGREKVQIDLGGLQAGWHLFDLSGALPPSTRFSAVVRGRRATRDSLTDFEVFASPMPTATPRLVLTAPVRPACEAEDVVLRGYVEAGADEALELESSAAELERAGSAFAVRTTGKPGALALRLGNARAQYHLPPCDRPPGETEPKHADLVVDRDAPYGQWVTPGRATTLSYAGATLHVPAGAVEEPVRITIRPVDASEVSPMNRGAVNTAPGGRSYRFGPHGLEFKRPVWMSLPYDREALPPAASEHHLTTQFFDERLQRWRPIPRIAAAHGGRVTSETTHFTEFTNATIAMPDGPGPASSQPDSMVGLDVGNPATGIDLIEMPQAGSRRSASLSYPLRTPPGRNGLAPGLGLQYDSDAGNGFLGVGWDLPLSAIEHDTRFGVPDYDAAHVQNVVEGAPAGRIQYLLDGQELIEEAPIGDGVRFMRRVEGSFERIVRRPDPTTPGGYVWEVTSTDNVRRIYGASAESRLADPIRAHRTFRWMLERVEDPFGNQVLYKYSLDRNTYGDSGVEMPALYPRRICYGEISQDTPDDCTGTYEVDFLFDDGAQRPDQEITARPGFPVRTRRRLEAVEVHYRDEAGNRAPIRSYGFDYRQGAFDKSLLARVAMSGQDGTEFYDHEFSYTQLPTPGSGPVRALHGDPYVWGSAFAGEGDTRSSLGLQHDRGRLSGAGGGVSLSLFSVLRVGVSAGGMWGNGRTEHTLAELTGDGLLDLVSNRGAGSLNLFRDPLGSRLGYGYIPNVGSRSLGATTQSGWTAGASIGIGVGTFSGSLNGNVSHNVSEDSRILADINGDGRADQVFLDGGTVRYLPGTRDGFAVNEDGEAFEWGFLDADEVVLANADRIEQQRQQHFLIDPLVRWEAPFAGRVQVLGSAQKLEARGGDGVMAFVYLNDTELWRHEFDEGEDGLQPCAPTPGAGCSGPLVVDVLPGDALYFRVTAIDDTRSDDLLWEPVIQYEGVDPELYEPYGAPIGRYDLAEDLRFTGPQLVPWAPSSSGIVVIEGAISKQETSDDVTLSVYRVHRGDQPTDLRTDRELIAELGLAAADEGQFAFSSAPWQSCPSCAGDLELAPEDLLVFELTSDAPVDPERVGWTPIVRFTHYDRPIPDDSETRQRGEVLFPCTTDPQDPDREVCIVEPDPTPEVPIERSLIESEAEVNYPVFAPEPGEIREFVDVAGDQAEVVVSVRQEGDQRAPVWLFVQQRNRLVAKAEVPDEEGIVTVETGGAVRSGEPITVTLVSEESLDRLEPLGLVVNGEQHTGQINLRQGSERRRYVPDALEGHDALAGGWHGFSYGDWRGDVAFDPSRISLQNLAARGDFFFAAQSTADRAYIDEVWTTRGQNGVIGRGIIVPARLHALRGFSRGDGSAQGARLEALRQSDTWTFGFGGSLGLGGASIEVGGAVGDTEGELEFIDINGDGFADSVTRDGVRYNLGARAEDGEFVDGLGFTAKRTAMDFDGFREVIQRNLRAKVGFSVGTEGNEADQPVNQTDTEGKTKSVVSTSFGVGLEYNLASANVEFIDVNGDGLPDRAAFQPDDGQMFVRLNLGYELSEPILWNAAEFAGLDSVGYRSDLIDTLEGGAGDSRRTGAFSASLSDTSSVSVGVSASVGANAGVVGVRVGGGAGYTYSVNRTFSGFHDVSGDGMPDMLARTDEGELRVRVNLGDHFGPEEVWQVPDWSPAISSRFEDLGARFALAGDAGRPQDALSFRSSRDYNISFNSEICYLVVCASVYTFSSWNNGGSTVSLTDFDGDGVADFVAKVDGLAEVHVKPGLATQINLLERVERPMGGHIELAYARYGNEVGLGRNPTVDLPRNQYALVRARVTDGREQTISQEFDYGGTGKWSRVERRDFGAAQVRVLRGERSEDGDGNPVVIHGDGSVVETTFHNQDVYRAGLAFREEERDDQGRRFTRTESTFDDPANPDPEQGQSPALIALEGSFFPAVLATVTEYFEQGEEPQTAYEERRLWSLQHGGVETYEMLAGEGTEDDLVYTVTYQTAGLNFASPDAPYFAKPSELTARGAGGTLYRQRAASYDPTTGALDEVRDAIVGGINPDTGSDYGGEEATFTIEERDEFGNVTRQVDANGYSLSYAYDPTGIYMTAATDSFGYSSSMTPDYRWGVPSQTTDVNGHSTRFTFDEFGRVQDVWGPKDPGNTAPTLRVSHGIDTSGPYPTRWTRVGHKDISRNDPAVAANDHDYVETISFMDGLARLIQTKKDHEQDDGAALAVGYIVSGPVGFDARGRLVQNGQPAFDAASSATELVEVALRNPTTNVLDVLGRRVSTTTPADPEDVGVDAVTVTTDYGFAVDSDGITRHRQRITDPRGLVREELSDVQRRTVEVRERVVSDEGGPIVTRYTYNPVGELVAVVDAAGNETAADYDTVGRMVGLHSPDMGTTTYGFDLVGNLRTKRTARLAAQNQQIEYHYDFNRLREIDYSDSPSRIFEYGTPEQAGDGFGNIAARVFRETSEAGIRELRYDELGNVTHRNETLNRLREPHRGPYRYEVQFEHDSFQRLIEVRYPDLSIEPGNPDQMALGDVSQEVIHYGYDAGGNLNRVFGLNRAVNPQHPQEDPESEYLLHIGYNEFGQRVRVISGNFIETRYTYRDGTRRLAGMDADHRDPQLRQQNQPARPFQRLTYRYDEVGNILEAANTAPFDEQMNASALVGELRHNYAYDDLDRLVHADGLVQTRRDWRHSYTLDFTYDDVHNLTSKAQQSFREVRDNGTYRIDQPIREQTVTATYRYTGAQPHAVSTITEQHPSDGPYDRTYEYDESGNQTRWSYRGQTREITWNEENLVSNVRIYGQDRSRNLYDAHNERQVSQHYVNVLEETAYIGQHLTIRDGAYLTKHVYAGDSILASKVDPAWFAEPPTLYYHTDHLGSAQYVTNDEQFIVQHDEYFPTGELWRDETDSRYSLARRYLFAGGEVDLGTGLHHFGVRYYDSRQGQWISPDPILAEYMTGAPNGGVFNPKNLNLYSYAASNPVRFRDPTGQCFDMDAECLMEVGAWVRGRVQAFQEWRAARRQASAAAYNSMVGNPAYTRVEVDAGLDAFYDGLVEKAPQAQAQVAAALEGAYALNQLVKAAYSRAAPRAAAAPTGTVGAARRLQYEPHGAKHGRVARGDASAAPKNGQDALDSSIPITENSSRRVGIDYEAGQYVVFPEHLPGRFHGYVVPWNKLTNAMRSALRKAGMADNKGRILRD